MPGTGSNNRKVQVGERQQRKRREQASATSITVQPVKSMAVPGNFSDKEKEAWRLFVPALVKQGIITSLDRPTLICAATCLAKVLESGDLRAIAEWRQYSKMYGLDVLSRQAIRPPKSEEKGSKLAQLRAIGKEKKA